MAIARSRLTSQGHVSVPAEVRRRLGIAAGSLLEWDEDGGQIVVRRAGRYTMWVLSTVYERDVPELGASVEQLLNHKDLILQDREVVAAALETFRSRPALGFTDCLLLEVARKAGHLPLGTFDRNLSRIEGAEKL